MCFDLMSIGILFCWFLCGLFALKQGAKVLKPYKQYLPYYNLMAVFLGPVALGICYLVEYGGKLFSGVASKSAARKRKEIPLTIIDEKGNERMLFGLVFADSHYYPEPTIGYSWVARWPVSQKYHVGAGYLLGLTFREDYHWLPIPLPLPVVKAGTDDVGLYMTYIPFTNVFFFYGTVATDSIENRLLPTFEGSPFANKLELYGAWMREKTDSATERGYMVSSDAGYLLGARYFVGVNWALDFTYGESDHDTRYRGRTDKTFEHTTYSAALQYHVNLAESLRMHAGLGIGYGKWEQKDGGIDEDSVFPVVQLGGTWAVTDRMRVLAGINMMFPRYHNVAPQGDVMFRPFPVQMYVGAGFAF